MSKITSENLLPNSELYREPEMAHLRQAAFDAVVGLIGKGYARSEVMEAIMSDAHTSAVTSILKLRVDFNKEVKAPWEDKE